LKDQAGAPGRPVAANKEAKPRHFVQFFGFDPLAEAGMAAFSLGTGMKNDMASRFAQVG
jgi:hypothetical protein